MADEKKAQVEDKSTEAQEVDVEAMKAQLAEAQAKLEEAQREAKSHQEFGRKTKAELDRQRHLESEVTSLRSELREAVTELFDAVESRGAEDEEERPRKRRSEEYRERFKQPTLTPEQQLEQQRFMVLGQEADKLLKEVGLQITDAEASQVYDFFRDGKPDAGLRATYRLVEQKRTEATKKTEESDTDKEAKRKQEIEEAARKMLEEKGVLKTDTGTPQASSGQVFTMAEVQRMSTSEYLKHFPKGFPDVAQAVTEGRVKV